MSAASLMRWPKVCGLVSFFMRVCSRGFISVFRLTLVIGEPIMLPMKWNELVTDLIGCGMTQQEIGAAVGLSQSSVSDIARGLTKDVGWSVGASILSLHQSRTGKAVGDRACSS